MTYTVFHDDAIDLFPKQLLNYCLLFLVPWQNDVSITSFNVILFSLPHQSFVLNIAIYI